MKMVYAEDVEEYVRSLMAKPEHYDQKLWREWNMALQTVAEGIYGDKAVPSVDIPVRLSKWVPVYRRDGEPQRYKCLTCRVAQAFPYSPFRYCPNCGTRMTNGGHGVIETGMEGDKP